MLWIHPFGVSAARGVLYLFIFCPAEENWQVSRAGSLWQRNAIASPASASGETEQDERLLPSQEASRGNSRMAERSTLPPRREISMSLLGKNRSSICIGQNAEFLAFVNPQGSFLQLPGALVKPPLPLPQVQPGNPMPQARWAEIRAGCPGFDFSLRTDFCC